ncbi:MAG: phosphotransferase [Thermomicrobiales bacterium]|nr:phosphotransferase [Thermomicrobiales bacterium]
MSSSLARNGYALIVSAGVTAVLGALFWIIAARTYSEAEIGIGGALISTLVTLSSAGQLNLGNILNRFIPTAGADAGRVILLTYAASAVAAVVVGIVFLLAVGRMVPALGFLSATPWLGAWFVLAIVVWTIFALQDSALAGLQEAGWVPLENSIYSLVKIGLLLAFAGFGTGLAIFAAWTAPLIAFVAVVTWLIFGRLLRARPAVEGESRAITLRQLLSFLGWDNVGALAMVAAMGIAPLLVLRVAGAEENAYYYLGWTISYSLYLIGRSMSISLLAEVAAAPRQTHSLVADTLVHTLATLGGSALAVTIAAPLVMSLFGDSYAAGGAAILRVLALASIPWGLVTLYVAVARAQGRMRVVAGLQVATLVIVLAVSWLLVGPLGGLGVALAWLAAHMAVLAYAVVAALREGGRTAALDWLLAVASAAARLLGAFRARFGRWQNSLGDAGDLLGSIAAADALRWEPLLTLPSLSDGETVYVGVKVPGAPALSPPEGARAIVKRARTGKGILALERNRDWLRRLAGQGGDGSCGFKVPEVLGWKADDRAASLVEGLVPGRDARSAFTDPETRAAALGLVGDAIGCLHRQTASTRPVDGAWLRAWIDEPAEMLRSIGSPLLSAAARGDAIEAFRERQRRYWTGTTIAMGWAHGDCSPGNIIFSKPGAPGRSRSEGLRLEGIVDWSEARTDAPRGFDLCHLALTMRMLRRRQELGRVVGELLEEPAWDPTEEGWLLDRASDADADPPGWPHEPAGVRAMVALAWLHHVTACLRKSERYGRARLWAASNIDWVLRLSATREGAP